MNGYFYSPTYGQLSFFDLRQKTLDFIAQANGHGYLLAVGTDSQPNDKEGTDFITAFVIYRVGSGGIYFWYRTRDTKKLVFRNRIYQEALLSLSWAQKILEEFREDGITKYNLEIHLDIGEKGETRKMFDEVVGYIASFGYKVKTKPEAYGASKVADRHT